MPRKPKLRRPPRGLALRAGLAAGVCALAFPVASASATGPVLKLRGARVETKTAPLALSVRAPRGAELDLRVNGRPVPDAFRFLGGKIHVADLDSSDGLRPGANRLRVRAEARRAVRTMSRTVTVPGFALSADAGADVGAHVGESVRLGVPAAGPAAAPGLHDSWRIVRRPRRARVTLTHRGSARAVLKAETPGTYVLCLTAHGKGGHGASRDELTVPVSPVDPPIGAPIETIGPNGAIVIGNGSFGGSSDPDTLSYVVLERGTRKPVPGASGSVNDDEVGIRRIADLARDYGKGQNYLNNLMVVSGRKGVRKKWLAEFGVALRKMGAEVPTPDNIAALENGRQFSVIGIPGAPPGAATTRIPSSPDAGVSGSITGYLERNPGVTIEGSEAFDYVSPDHPTYDTSAAGSNNRKNVMTVGNSRFEASLPPDAKAGLHVVMLDSLTLRPLDSAALATNSSIDPSQDSAMQGGAADWIKTRLDRFKDPLVLVQTIGKPKAAPRWEEVVGQLSRLGANPLLLNYLNDSNEYALVGRLGSEQPPAEASTAHDGPGNPRYPPARLVGVLGRTRASTLEPMVTDTPTPKSLDGTVNLEMIKIAYQPAQPWPTLGGGAPPAEAAAAEQFICKALGFCKAADSCPDMRTCYWEKPGSEWKDKSTELSILRYPGPGLGFTVGVFEAVKTELQREILMMDQVRANLHRLQEPLEKTTLQSYVDLQAIGTSVKDAVTPPPTNDATGWTLGLVGKIAALGGAAGGSIGTVAKGLSAAFALGAYLSEQKGKPILGADLEAKTAELAQQLLDRVNLARTEMTVLERLYLSDYGKLTAAYSHVDSDWSIDNPYKATEDIRLAARQWFYEALVPAAYPYLIRASANNARQLVCPLGINPGWPNQPDSAQMLAPVGYRRQAIFFFTRGIWGGSSPPGTLGDAMFLPRTGEQTGAAMEKLKFFTPRVFSGQILHAVTGQEGCDVGFLPSLR